jgi:hypothetical protein
MVHGSGRVVALRCRGFPAGLVAVERLAEARIASGLLNHGCQPARSSPNGRRYSSNKTVPENVRDFGIHVLRPHSKVA